MKKVSVPKVVTAVEASESPLPARVQEALGELVGAAKEGLLALSVGVGLGVVHERMVAEVDEVVGPKASEPATGPPKRHGHEDTRARPITTTSWRSRKPTNADLACCGSSKI